MALPTYHLPAVRKILHIDMDAFYASIEQRENPALRGRPVAVGGAKRGVVMAASYEARVFGVRSAMPSSRAQRLCPDLVFVKPRFELYREASLIIREIFLSYTDLVEPVSIDEAYLDVTEASKGSGSATLIARAIKEEIRATTGLTATAGVSFNKFLAKTASTMQKPDGLTVILPEEAEGILDELSIERFHGIGPATARRMREHGIESGADLRSRTEEDLRSTFGKAGGYYYRMVRGLDDRPVRVDRVRKSLGAERTFEHDVRNVAEMIARLEKIAEEVARRAEKSSAWGRTITLKIKYGDFTISTRSRTFEREIATVEDLRSIGRELLLHPAPPLRPVRLLGLTLSNLGDPNGREEDAQLALEL